MIRKHGLSPLGIDRVDTERLLCQEHNSSLRPGASYLWKLLPILLSAKTGQAMSKLVRVIDGAFDTSHALRKTEGDVRLGQSVTAAIDVIKQPAMTGSLVGT